MKNKTTWIIVGIVLAVIILIVGIFAGANNKAIFLEEQINGAQANINVAENAALIWFITSWMQCRHIRIMRAKRLRPLPLPDPV